MNTMLRDRTGGSDPGIGMDATVESPGTQKGAERFLSPWYTASLMLSIGLGRGVTEWNCNAPSRIAA